MIRRWLSLLLVAALLGGCAVFAPEEPPPTEEPAPIDPAPPPPPEDPPEVVPFVPPDNWKFEAEALKVRINPADDLNFYRNRSHTLVLGVYQLSDPNPFNDKRSTAAGLQQLLTEGLADPTIVAFKRVVVQPGKSQPIVLDRAEGAKQIGFVAGYYKLEADRVTRLIPIPAIQDPKTGWARFNPFADPPPPRPARMGFWVELGSQEIVNIETRAE